MAKRTKTFTRLYLENLHKTEEGRKEAEEITKMLLSGALRALASLRHLHKSGNQNG